VTYASNCLESIMVMGGGERKIAHCRAIAALVKGCHLRTGMSAMNAKPAEYAVLLPPARYPSNQGQIAAKEWVPHSHLDVLPISHVLTLDPPVMVVAGVLLASPHAVPSPSRTFSMQVRGSAAFASQARHAVHAPS